MQETGPTPAESDATESRRPGFFRRFLLLWLALLALVLLAIIPPLISVNRYQHRIATSISQSLGRPVHLDRVTLNLLPLPGFTLQNLVVDEDPAFGFEPIIRANSVRATLRIRSLWTRRVEFSSISFTDPSVNLVHLANGKW
ncbi:MAG: AsmA family protein, partial [Edaphobacter sp.]